MGHFEDLLTYKVDFNNFAPDGKLLKGSLWHGSSHRIPRPGERVLLCDGEGNRCEGTVHDLRGVILRFELDDSTWATDQRTVAVVGTSSGNVIGVWSPGQPESS